MCLKVGTQIPYVDFNSLFIQPMIGDIFFVYNNERKWLNKQTIQKFL